MKAGPKQPRRRERKCGERSCGMSMIIRFASWWWDLRTSRQVKGRAMDRRDFVKKATAAAALSSVGGVVWSAYQRLCDENGTMILRLDFDDDNLPYLYDEASGPIVKNLLSGFDVEIKQDHFERVVITQTITTDKRRSWKSLKL